MLNPRLVGVKSLLIILLVLIGNILPGVAILQSNDIRLPKRDTQEDLPDTELPSNFINPKEPVNNDELPSAAPAHQPIQPENPKASSMNVNNGSMTSLYEGDYTGGSWLDSFEDGSGINWTASSNLVTINGDVKVEIPPPTPPNPDKNTVALWRFNEGEGNTIYDDTVYNNHGNILGNAKWTTNKFCKCLKFDGVDDRIDIPDSPSLSITGSITISAWVNFTQLPGSGKYYAITKKRVQADDSYQMFIDSKGAVGCAIDPGSISWVYANTSLNDGKWHFIAMTWDQSKIRLYVDGKLDVTPVSKTGSMADTNRKLSMGFHTERIDVNKWAYYNGYLDEVWISKIARSGKEMKEIYNNYLVKRNLKANLISNQIYLPLNMNWNTLLINATQLYFNSLLISILDGPTNKVIKEIKWININEFDISNIDPLIYSSIRLQTTLTSTPCGLTPSLHYWGVSWNASSAWRDSLFSGLKVQTSNLNNADGECWQYTSPTEWIKYSKNPVLSTGSTSNWDGLQIFSPTIVYNGSGYMMWYCGHKGATWQIGLAISMDGLSWTKYSGNPVLTVGKTGSWNEAHVGSPCVIFDGKIYKMWYQGQDVANTDWQTGYATSTDGINWKKHPNNPVIKTGVKGEWDDHYVCAPSIYYDGNIYHNWYTGLSQIAPPTYAPYLIGYATSYDGINWTKYSMNPIIKSHKCWYYGKSSMSVLRCGTQYYGWYNFNKDGINRMINFTTSNDGVNWVDHSKNPVLQKGSSGFWDDDFIGSCEVILREHQYWMYYTGNDGSKSQIGLAKSKFVTSGQLNSTIIDLPKLQLFDKLIINKTEPPGSFINISVLDVKTNKPIKNFTELTGSVINISTLNLNGYASIRLVANFSSNQKATPILYNWAVTWESLPELEAIAGGPYIIDEGSSVELQGKCITHHHLLSYQYRWDLDNDSIFDTIWNASSVYKLEFSDDFNGTVGLQILDNFNRTEIAYAQIIVKNVAPKVNLRIHTSNISENATMSVRIAGEKWHDVFIELFKDGKVIENGTLVRYPGSPNEQMLHFPNQTIDSEANWTAVLRYTPADDPVNGKPNGATPCWVILKLSNGSKIKLHHTFNVRHNNTHIWIINLTPEIPVAMYNATITHITQDPGADELMFYWEFGDGTNLTIKYTNYNNIYPVIIIENLTHIYSNAGTYKITLTVKDDDGGITVIKYTITLE